MGSRRNRLVYLVAVLALTVSLLAVGCTKEEETTTLTPYAIPVMTDITGPLSVEAVPVMQGLDLWFDYLNRYEGGINGREIVLRYYDTRTDPSLVRSIHTKLVGDLDPAIELHFVSGTASMIKDVLTEDHVVGYSAGGSAGAYIPPGWVFVGRSGMAEQVVNFTKWAMAKMELDRPLKMGFLLADAYWGREAELATPWLLANGVEVVGVQYMSMAPTDLTPQLLALAALEPDYVCAIHMDPGMRLMCEQNADLGTDLTFFGVPSWDATVLLDSPNPEVFEGMLQVFPLCQYTDDVPGITLLNDMVRETMPQIYPPGGVLAHGWIQGMVATRVIQNVVDEFGWEGVTGDNVYNAFIAMDDIDTMGMSAPLDWTENKKCGQTMSRIYEIIDGKPMDVSGWFEPEWAFTEGLF
ncbi:ABC transporter substrate-binding protein [Chloroflexota bacterium]